MPTKRVIEKKKKEWRAEYDKHDTRRAALYRSGLKGRALAHACCALCAELYDTAFPDNKRSGLPLGFVKIGKTKKKQTYKDYLNGRWSVVRGLAHW